MKRLGEKKYEETWRQDLKTDLLQTKDMNGHHPSLLQDWGQGLQKIDAIRDVKFASCNQNGENNAGSGPSLDLVDAGDVARP